MDATIYSITFAFIAFALSMAFKTIDHRLTLVSCFLFAAYLGLDDLVTSLPKLLPILNVIPGQWNWEGKLLSIALALTVIVIFRMNPQATGLVLKQRNLKVSIITCALYIPWAIFLGFTFKPEADFEALVFQATMPGLAEELAFRGIAPALLLNLIHNKQAKPGIPWTIVFSTSLMFGLWHGLGYSAGAYSFDYLAVVLTGFGGFIACWLRFNSGSLLFPVLLHCLANLAFQLTALVTT